MKLSRILGPLVVGALSLLNAVGQQLPLVNDPATTPYNFQSRRGVPISNTTNVPPGSDGRAPGPVPGPLGTPNQFQGLMTLGGTVRNTTGATNTSGVRLLTATRTRLGTPFQGSSFAYLFGEVIPPPSTDEYGISLAVTNAILQSPQTSAALYWLT